MVPPRPTVFTPRLLLTLVTTRELDYTRKDFEFYGSEIISHKEDVNQFLRQFALIDQKSVFPRKVVSANRCDNIDITHWIVVRYTCHRRTILTNVLLNIYELAFL